LQSLKDLVARDTVGNIEAVMPLIRLGVVTAPLTVALRAAAHAVIAWCTLIVLNSRVPFRSAFRTSLIALPILELSAIVDAVGTLASKGEGANGFRLPMALDSLMSDLAGRELVIARSVGLPLVLWSVVFFALLTRVESVNRWSAVAAILATAALVVALPILGTVPQ
jgi:hypothetical protein